MMLRRLSRLATSSCVATSAARTQRAVSNTTSSFAARLQDGPGLADFVQAGADPLSAQHSGLDQVRRGILLAAANGQQCARK